MKLNFNNEKELSLTKVNLKNVLNLVDKKIQSDSEHLWLEYKKGKKSIEKKWLRTEYTNEEIVEDVEKFLLKAVK